MFATCIYIIIYDLFMMFNYTVVRSHSMYFPDYDFKKLISAHKLRKHGKLVWDEPIFKDLVQQIVRNSYCFSVQQNS